MEDSLAKSKNWMRARKQKVKNCRCQITEQGPEVVVMSGIPAFVI